MSAEENKQTNKSLMLFQVNTNHPSLHYEKLEHFRDSKLRSIRVNQGVRIILAVIEGEDLFLILYVGHHDEAYDWAKSRQIDINPETQALQVYSVVEETLVEKASSVSVPGLFDHVKDKHLLQLGVPQAALPLVRTMKIEADLENARDQEQLPLQAYEALYILMAGGTFEEAYKETLPEREPEAQTTISFIQALANPEAQRSFVVAENEAELKQVLSESIEKWRVFLHPLQRRLATGPKNGSVRVLGGAGTGKTVVAMHRAKWLATNMTDSSAKVLFTTFTKNLATDIRQNLQTICTQQQMEKIEVVNLDSWVMNYLKHQGYDYNLLMNSKDEDSLWKAAFDEKPQELDFDITFFKEEWAHIVQPQSLKNVDEYKRAKRIGRGTRLTREQRVQIWAVFDEYRRQLSKYQYKETDDAYRDACDLIQQNPAKSPKYAAVIVDEAQDMGTQAFRLIRAIVPEGKNDLFIVGDGHQRIYGKNKVVLSQCGIDIRGRSTRLKINYRTTDETRKAAVAILEGVEVDDLDGGTDSNRFYHSLMHGPAPELQNFASLDEQSSGIKSIIESLAGEPSACCIVARTNKEIKAIEASLMAKNVPIQVLDGRSLAAHKSSVNLATMHRVKGLEFDYVILASANKGLIPLEFVVANTGDQVSRRHKENEERALVYVSMTRARKRTFIFSYGQMSEFF